MQQKKTATTKPIAKNSYQDLEITPCEFGVDRGLIKEISNVLSMIPENIMDAIPKERLV